MKRLGGTDALFLSMETPSWHQHIGGLTILDPEGRDVSFDDIVQRLSERIVYAPKFTWKIKEIPFGLDRPVWIDDPDFDIKNHVRRVAVPSPGGQRELGELAGTIMGMQLDRRKPLWEVWLIEGMANGKLALFMKYHHCLLDGVSGASLATALMDLEPGATAPMVPLPSPEEASAGPDPSDLTLLAEVLRPNPRRPLGMARYATGLVQKGITMVDGMRKDERNRTITRFPKAPWNGSIGPRRNLAFASVSMADLNTLKKHHGVKVNDVVLAIVSGALRQYLIDHDALPEQPLVTGVPISTRAEGDTTMDNQVSNMFVGLATDVGDPIDRLKSIHESTNSAKAMAKAIGARQIQSLGEVASPLILSTAIRAVYRTQLMSRMPIGTNTVVSNVPGPPIPLYMCGAKVTGIFPSSVILEGMGLNITVFSYQDRLDFGLCVDPDLVPDAWDMADKVPFALAELMKASGLGKPTKVVLPTDDTSKPERPLRAARATKAPAAKAG